MNHELRLADMICGAGPEASSLEVDKASRHFADLVGVTLAALGEPQVSALARLVSEAGPARTGARAWGTSRRLSLRDAGLLNGFAAHFHDFDDDETEIAMAHVTVSAMTAAAIVGDSRSGLSGDAVMRAYLAGTETAMRIGALVNPGHYRRGWHATATLGVFAACAAAGRLFGLGPLPMRHALGIAASFAAGIRSNFGTDAKPLQVGQAVSSGIFAAECALSGLQSSPGSLLGPRGYVALQEGDQSRVEAIIERFGAPYGFSAGGMVIKAYPCCTASHSAISGLLSLVAGEAGLAERITGLRCHVDPAVRNILVYESPATVAEAKFSLPFSLAVAAAYGRAGIPEFSDAALADPRVRGLMARVTQIDDVDLPKGPSGISVAARIFVDLADGTTRDAYCPAVPGSAGNPPDDAALAAKFVACSEPWLGRTQAAALFETLLATPRMPDFSVLADSFVPAGRNALPFAKQR